LTDVSAGVQRTTNHDVTAHRHTDSEPGTGQTTRTLATKQLGPRKYNKAQVLVRANTFTAVSL